MSDQPFGLPTTPMSPGAPPPRRRRMPIWLMLILGVVGLCIVGFIALVAYAMSPAGQAAQRERATAQAGTAVALADEEQQLRERSTQIYDEPFDSNDLGFNLEHAKGSSAEIADGVYRVTFDDEAFRSAYSGDELTDFIAELDCTTVKGGGDAKCGITFAVNERAGKEDETDQYWFFVSGSKYGLRTEVGSSDKSWSKSNGAVKNDDGQTNHLKVVRINNEMRLYVNDTLVDQINDDKLPKGGVGFQTGAEKKSVVVEVDNFQVWQPDTE